MGSQLAQVAEQETLMIAVADVRIDGKRIEGQGVTPDVTVPFDARRAAGADPQLDRAIRVLLELLGPRPAR